MSSIHPGLVLIMQRFPAEKDHLRRMYLSDPSFQIICDDYQQCMQALAFWRRSADEQAPERFREYQSLRNDLEGEIEEHIGTMR